ncbi:RF-1 domain-containing protein [Powellomyces hirtus]|nr:RF-1 domain-containing protein [Powellomyces hirtus]
MFRRILASLSPLTLRPPLPFPRPSSVPFHKLSSTTPELPTPTRNDALPSTPVPTPPECEPQIQPPPPPPLKPAKKIPIVLLEQDIEEAFVKGSGPGGQKINKCRHRVQLRHIPTNIRVESQRFRDLTSNRKEARKLLALKLDELHNGALSKRQVRIALEQKRKARAAQKTKKKHKNNPGMTAADVVDGDGVETENTGSQATDGANGECSVASDPEKGNTDVSLDGTSRRST